MRILPLLLAIGLAFPALADEVRLQENAPDKHVVVKGDTLWDISAKFLKDPWKWPQVWRLNRDQIKNPHLIYPGDVVWLSFVDGQPRLSLEKGRFGETIKLSPRVHGEPIVIKEKGIPVIDPKAIAPFLGLGAVVSKEALESGPRLLGAVDERVLIMVGDQVYASPGEPGTQDWQVYRPGNELVDPDSGEKLGFEAHAVGQAHTVVPGNPQTLRIEKAAQEIAIGDRLLPYRPVELEAMVPHAPERDVLGKIISAFGGVAASSQFSTVVINQGARDGLEPGHVLAIHRQGRVLQKDEEVKRHRYMSEQCVKPGHKLTFDFYDPKAELMECDELPPDSKQEAWRYMDVGCLKPGAHISTYALFNPKDVYDPHCRSGDKMVRLPEHRVGLMFLYRVYDKVSYGLIMQADGPIYLLDNVRNP